MRNTLLNVLAAIAIFVYPSGLWAQKTEASYYVDAKTAEKVKAEIAKQVIDAYQTKEVYNLMTPNFNAVENAALKAEDETGYLCIDGDYFYCTQDIYPKRFEIKKVSLISKAMAAVHVMLIFDEENYQNTESVVLIMVLDAEPKIADEKKWLVDDVWFIWKPGSYSSVKQGMIECVINN